MNVRYIGPVKISIIDPDGVERVITLSNEDVKMHFRLDQEPRSVADKATSKQDDLLQERGSEYSDAWILTTEVMSFLWGKRYDMMTKLTRDTSYLYAWMTILCKLLRAITTPTKADHWRDIAGYATLVAEHIETGSRGR